MATRVSNTAIATARTPSFTMTLTNPNGNLIRTLLSNAPQSAGSQTVEWNGRNDAGQVVSVDGDYKITLTAVDAASGFASSRTGTVVVYK